MFNCLLSDASLGSRFSPVHARADAGCLACNGQANETQDLHIEPAPIFSADRSEMFYADPLPNPL
jgi:hypothetical protein